MKQKSAFYPLFYKQKMKLKKPQKNTSNSKAQKH